MRKLRKILSLTVATLFCLSLSLNAFASVNFVVDWTSDRGYGQAHGKSSGSGPISSSGSQGTTNGSYNFINGSININVSYNTSPILSEFNNRQGAGWETGMNNRVINYNVGSFNHTSGSIGGAFLCGYGWTINPIIEYYIVETWRNFSNNVGNRIGNNSFVSDGSTYNAYWQNVNGTNITGSGPYKNLKSVRTFSGTPGWNQRITFQNHVNFWNSNGHPLGTHNYQAFIVENLIGAGNANFYIW